MEIGLTLLLWSDIYIFEKDLKDLTPKRTLRNIVLNLLCYLLFNFVVF